MKFFAFVALLLMASAVGSAEHTRMRLVQPRGTELVVTKLVRTNELFAKFSGQVWVSGTVIGRWPVGATNLSDKTPDYLLIPDQVAAAKLPYFVMREPPHFLQYKVRSIQLLNGEAALRIAAGTEKTRRLLERRVNHIRVTGRFLIAQYEVGVECDAPWAKAVLVEAETPENVSAHNMPATGC